MAGEAVSNADEFATPSRGELDHEAELVRRAKERSWQAWTEIYEQHHPKIFRYVQARVSDRETAEDLASTVFLEALKSIDTYSSRGRPLLAWLYRIARNVVNYHYRASFRKRLGQGLTGEAVRRLLRLGRETGEAEGEATPALPAEESADPSALVESWDLRQAVARLSTDQREVIILRYFVGLTTPEVAAVLGKHERAVYSLQTRAIKALRRLLG